ncbi:MAG: hypothetical protein K1X88_18910 [Nannocystaceae bacterium]|nr:hypothetical protein [Nannocystaceae bacterium]
MLDPEVASELHDLVGWVRPYALLRNAVVVAARTLAASAKAVLLSSGEALPLPLRFEESTDEEATTRRILVEPDPAANGEGDERLRVVLLAPEGGEPEGVRTVRWDGDPERPEQLISAIRELAGLPAAS